MKRLLESLLRRACEWFAAHQTFPLREITRGVPPNEEPYLDRYYLFGRKPAYFPEQCKYCKRPMEVTSASGGPAKQRVCAERGDLGRFADRMMEGLGVAEELCEPIPFPERLSFLPTVFLHHFRDSDQEELHNHPWEKALSFILVGGYAEERCVYRDTDSIVTEFRDVHPFSFNTIRKDDYHRVTLFGHDAWTLFITGEKAQSWGFLSKKNGDVIPWRQYRAWKEAKETKAS